MLRFRQKKADPKRSWPAGVAGDRRGKPSLAEKFDFAFVVLYCGMASLLAGRLLVALMQGALPAQPPAHVGDVVDFSELHTPPGATGRVIVPALIVAGPWARPSRACALDVSYFSKAGAIATVVSVGQDGVMLSWAEAAAGRSPDDCRGGETILLTNANYQRLISMNGTGRPTR